MHQLPTRRPRRKAVTRTVLTGAAATLLIAAVPPSCSATPDGSPTGAGTDAAEDAAEAAGPSAPGAADPEIGFQDGYYDDAIGKTGDELKAALHDIISDQDTLTYDEVWGALRETDQDPNDPDSVVLLYSGHSRGADENGGDVGDWNREHVWPQSRGDFGTSPGPGTDLHHLRPADVQVNSERGNKDFDEGGTEVEGAPGNYTDEDSFEPRDDVKGDVARMVFYMAVRYEGTDNFADLELTDEVDNGSQPVLGRVSVLLEWHEADPPDAAEEARNQLIHDEYQTNRNPFVDHPEWAEEIWG